MATADLGRLGPRESDPQFINWSIWWSLTRSIPWVLPIVLLGARPNRRLAAWAVILPLAAVVTISSLLYQVLPSPEEFLPELFIAREVVLTLALALTGLWLIFPWLARGNRLITFGLAVVMTVALAALFTIFTNGFYFDSNVTESIFVTVLAATALMLGLAGNVLWCGGRPGDRSFLFWLLPCIWTASVFIVWIVSVTYLPGHLNLRDLVIIFIIFSILSGLVLYLVLPPFVALCIWTALVFIVWVASVMYIIVNLDLRDLISSIIFFSTVSGLVLYLVLLPFVALALRSEFYRRRLYACTRLPWLAADDESPTVPETLLPETMREFDGESP